MPAVRLLRELKDAVVDGSAESASGTLLDGRSEAPTAFGGRVLDGPGAGGPARVRTDLWIRWALFGLGVALVLLGAIG